MPRFFKFKNAIKERTPVGILSHKLENKLENYHGAFSNHPFALETSCKQRGLVFKQVWNGHGISVSFAFQMKNVLVSTSGKLLKLL